LEIAGALGDHVGPQDDTLTVVTGRRIKRAARRRKAR
jgi:hypothetical protein